MTELRPLVGYVVAPHVADEVVAPPYDALTPDERSAYIAAHPMSFLGVLPEAEYTDGSQHDLARQRLTELIHEGAYEPHGEGFVAIYRLTEDGHTQTGLIADVPVEMLEAGRVRPHEHTRPDRVATITRFLDQVGVASSPVSLAFGDDRELRAAIADATRGVPNVTVTDRGVHQELWVVDDHGAVIEAARGIGDLYITDGHHRSAAALEYARGPGRHRPDAQALLAVLFPADELRLVDYHRIVEQPVLRADEIAETLRAADWGVTALETLEEPSAPRRAVLVSGAGCYRLELPPRETGVGAGRAAALDVARFYDEVLGAVLGIDDPRSHPGIGFVPGDRGVGRLVDLVSGTDAVGFALHPPRMDDLIAVAEAGEVMPPKSTYFTPKVRSGLVLRFRH